MTACACIRLESYQTVFWRQSESGSGLKNTKSADCTDRFIRELKQTPSLLELAPENKMVSSIT